MNVEEMLDKILNKLGKEQLNFDEIEVFCKLKESELNNDKFMEEFIENKLKLN